MEINDIKQSNHLKKAALIILSVVGILFLALFLIGNIPGHYRYTADYPVIYREQLKRFFGDYMFIRGKEHVHVHGGKIPKAGDFDYYDDFDLTLEFKQEANGNSGVFFRSFVQQPAIVNGWQVEVAPKGHDTAGIYESYGRGWLVQIPDEKENILKEGEWNTLRILAEGDRVQTWLNGEPMVDITDEKVGAGRGRIALQIHDGGGIKVRWRNLHLKTL